MSYLVDLDNEVGGEKKLNDKDLLSLCTEEVEKGLFDSIQIAALMVECNVAWITLFKGEDPILVVSSGIEANEVDHSTYIKFSYAASHADEPVVIEDLQEASHAVFASLPPNEILARFFIGIPIVTGYGYPIGSLCLTATRPRKLKPELQRGLWLLSKQIGTVLDGQLRRNKENLFTNQIDLIHQEVLRLQDPGVGMPAFSTLSQLEALQRGIDQRFLSASWDRTGVVRSMNTICQNQLGITQDEWSGSSYPFLQKFFCPSHSLRQIMATLLRGEIWKGKLCHQSDEENIRWIEAVLIPISTQLDNRYDLFHFIGNDITKNITLEAKTESWEEQLGKLTNTVLEQNRKIESFTSIISHNLRSPVYNLKSLLQLYHNLKTEKEKEFIFSKFETVINHLEETLNTLVDGLIARKSLTKECLRFEEVLAKILEMVTGDIMETHASITTDFSQAPEIYYNREYMESILLNLVTNALKYRSPLRLPSIHIETQRTSQEEIVLLVKDNGMGIDLDKYGNKLFGLKRTFHGHKEAKGVGLFITKNQVEAMNGRISATSEVNKGTIFSVSFDTRENC